MPVAVLAEFLIVQWQSRFLREIILFFKGAFLGFFHRLNFLENHPISKVQHPKKMFPNSPLVQLMHTCVLGQRVIHFQPVDKRK